jgi:hypothetical protein
MRLARLTEDLEHLRFRRRGFCSRTLSRAEAHSNSIASKTLPAFRAASSSKVSRSE